MHACNFLDVPYPENWDKLTDWAEEKYATIEWFIFASRIYTAENFQKLTTELYVYFFSKTVAGWFGASGLTSRRVQLKAPGKIKAFMKNHLGKGKHSKPEDVKEEESSGKAHENGDNDKEWVFKFRNKWFQTHGFYSNRKLCVKSVGFMLYTVQLLSKWKHIRSNNQTKLRHVKLQNGKNSNTQSKWGYLFITFVDIYMVMLCYSKYMIKRNGIITNSNKSIRKTMNIKRRVHNRVHKRTRICATHEIFVYEPWYPSMFNCIGPLTLSWLFLAILWNEQEWS